MKRTIVLAILCAAAGIACVPAWADESSSVVVTPYGVDYPLISPTGYISRTGDSFEKSFGVRRWLPATGAEENNHQTTLKESHNFFVLYGGYGVLGKGEEVFTHEAARWRKAHRGRIQ